MKIPDFIRDDRANGEAGRPPWNRGVALIMVLWVVAILSIIAFEFCFAMRTEVNVARNYKEEIQLYAMAEGGVHRAIAELIYKHDARIQQMRKNFVIEEIPPEKKEWVADGRPYPFPFEQGTCEIRMMSEAGKIGINTVSENTLRKIIGQMGLEGETRDVVVDSIVDWRDPDDLHHLNGAENDYYRSLKEPYDAKNADLDAIEELLLVKGVTPALFYGRKGPKRQEIKDRAEPSEGSKPEGIGLKDLFSVYSSSELIDINSAALPVLRVVLGLPNEVAQSVVKAREEKPFQHQQDLVQRVPEISPMIAEASKLISYQATMPFYTIECRAKARQGGSVQGLKAIVKIDQKEKTGYKVIQWLDQLL